jgi:hypothetical protein
MGNQIRKGPAVNTVTVLLPAALAGFLWLCCPALVAADEGQPLDLAAFGQWMTWGGEKLDRATPVKSLPDVPDDVQGVGVQWDDPRDVRELVAGFAGDAPAGVVVEYWFRIWPPPPPHMPTMEDEIDDPWQGNWLRANTRIQTRGGQLDFTFEPLGEENPHSENLPGVTYRRTLKVRLVLPEGSPRLQSLAVHSDSVVKPLSVRVQLACGQKDETVWSGGIEVFNGKLESVTPWQFDEGDRFDSPASWKDVRIGEKPKGFVVKLLESRSRLRGSNDITVVTVRATMKAADRSLPRTFSFSTRDLEVGPIYVPDMDAYVTKSDDPKPFDPSVYSQRKKIRDLIPLEPEQSYERATQEIPPQDPWVRQHGDMVYLVAAADSSWQKFAVRYDGNIFISRSWTKAFGAEARRLKWPGDTIQFWIGTGVKPYFREDHQGSMAVAEENLPIMINRWEHGGLQYEQESFATLLEGPLDPNDPARSEQTPAVLMLKLRARNTGHQARTAHFWFQMKPDDPIEINGRRIISKPQWGEPPPGPILRAVITPPAGANPKLERLEKVASEVGNAVTCQYEVPAGATQTLYLTLPFVSDVAGADADKLEALRYDKERTRVADYWRSMIERTTRFSAPERKFNYLSQFVIPHIHISTTKDPKSGLYMVPAASYCYSVYANEACFQAMLLDALGDTKRAGQYLDTFVALQGSRMFCGTYTPPHDGVYHGARVGKEYDYTASEYNLDHGTVLWSLARHYKFTRDKAWLEKTLPSMFKAVEWIVRQRKATMHNDVYGHRPIEYGLLPAGHLEDNADWACWFAINAYCVAGMTEMAEAMADIGHTDAEKIAEQAAAYREDLRSSVIRTAEISPVVKMRDGTYSPYITTKARQRFRLFGPLQAEYYSRYNQPQDAQPCFRLSGTRELLYGPMILLDLGIFEPQEPIADWILDDWEDNLTLSGERRFNVHGITDEKLWFSQGGMVWQSNLQNPIQAYLRRNEVPAAIRNIYNNFVACLYPDVNTLTEEYRMWCRASGPFYKSPDEARFVNRLRDMLVLESGDDLWLASGAPRRWLASKEGIRVEEINSYFGPVAFSMRAGDEPNTILATVRPPTRNVPKDVWLYVRIPDARPIKKVEIDGQEWTDIDAGHERIRLPKTGEAINVVVRH